jgi:SAM-dependent methyltransferase
MTPAFPQARRRAHSTRYPAFGLACVAMSAHVSDATPGGLPLTGERTVPDLAQENYWFRRHEVAYQFCTDICAGQEVLEAGCGEGYGADLLAGTARRVVAVDYDAASVAHVRSRYPRVEVIEGNLVSVPLPDASVDVVVNFQVIEHLWDQPQFITECLRLLRPGGRLLISTPNRITFTPGGGAPLNPFHTRELDAAELAELLRGGGFALESMHGVFHGPRLAEMDARHGGSIVDAQIARAVSGAPWPAGLLADVAAIGCADFAIRAAGECEIDASLDLLAIATRP